MTIAQLQSLAGQVNTIPPEHPQMFAPRPYYHFLKRLVGVMSPDIVVELGVERAGGSYYMAVDHPNTLVIGIDLELNYPEHVLFVDHCCPNWIFLQLDSVRAAQCVEGIGKIGMIFIDTTPTAEQLEREWSAWYPLLDKGAVVCVNCLNLGGRADVWSRFPFSKKRLDFLSKTGFGVMICP